eukprot:scpid35057/ scgid25251/ 
MNTISEHSSFTGTALKPMPQPGTSNITRVESSANGEISNGDMLMVCLMAGVGGLIFLAIVSFLVFNHQRRSSRRIRPGEIRANISRVKSASNINGYDAVYNGEESRAAAKSGSDCKCKKKTEIGEQNVKSAIHVNRAQRHDS